MPSKVMDLQGLSSSSYISQDICFPSEVLDCTFHFVGITSFFFTSIASCLIQYLSRSLLMTAQFGFQYASFVHFTFSVRFLCAWQRQVGFWKPDTLPDNFGESLLLLWHNITRFLGLLI